MLKRTKVNECNRKLGILIGPKVDVAALREYEFELHKMCNLRLDEFELKRKNEKEGHLESLCVAACAIEIAAERIDSKLRTMVINSSNSLIHYSFINGTSEKR